MVSSVATSIPGAKDMVYMKPSELPDEFLEEEYERHKQRVENGVNVENLVNALEECLEN